MLKKYALLLQTMRFRYLLYPEAQSRLEDGGLLKRMQEVRDNERGLPFVGYTIGSDVVQAVSEMQKDGYYETIPEDEKKSFMVGLNDAFKDRGNHKWKVHRDGKVIEDPVTLEDFYLMTGWLSSFVLGKDEIWDCKKFGFQSLNDFVGCVGAAVWSLSHTNWKEGYKWITTTPSGRMFKNQITGDMNLDLRIYQTDITPDETIDPTGAEVLYRPELDEDKRCVAAYHSTELDFLVGILKWVHQQQIPSEMLKDRGMPLIEYAKSLGHIIGPATECYGFEDRTLEPRLRLDSFYFPIPVLNENYSTDKLTLDGVHVDAESFFGMYVGPSKELIFSYHGKGEIQHLKRVDACFLPSEADHLLKGICYQSAKGLGRTVPKDLISLIGYRFSGEMDKDIEALGRGWR